MTCLLVTYDLLYHPLSSIQGVKTTTKGQAGTVLGPFDKEVCLTRGPYPWRHNGEGNLYLGHSRQHTLLDLDFRSHTIPFPPSFLSRGIQIPGGAYKPYW